jgi:hypothetical protein
MDFVQNNQKISCITAFNAVIYAHRQTTQTAENMINQLTACGRIGAKNENESFKKHEQRSTRSSFF